jgi:hypothetical protein
MACPDYLLRLCKLLLATRLKLGASGAVQAQEKATERVEPIPIVRRFENFPFPVPVLRGLYELEPVGEP